MEKRTLEIGDILQINPDHPNFPGLFLVVTGPKKWGAQGYLLHSRDFEATKYMGRAFLRVKFEEVEFCGHVEWLEYEKEELENG
jgi:hypothetical protein